MNYTARQYLATIASSPRTMKHFTHNSLVPSNVAEVTMQALLDAGYIKKDKYTYSLTQQGRAYLDDAGRQAEPRSFVAEGSYTGVTWHIREGGEEHKQYKSRGYGC